MRDVAGVTLLCVDTANHALALRALAVSGAELRFEQTLFLTDSIPAHVDVPVAGQTFLTPATDLQEFLRENLPGRSADETVISR